MQNFGVRNFIRKITVPVPVALILAALVVFVVRVFRPPDEMFDVLQFQSRPVVWGQLAEMPLVWGPRALVLAAFESIAGYPPVV